LLASLALASCSDLPSTPLATTTAPPPVASDGAAPPAIATPGTPDSVSTAPVTPSGQGARAVPASTGLANDDPTRLMGLDQDGLQKLLGTPSFMRRDAPAQLWRYAGTGCILDIFLYRNGASGPFVVKHLAARSTTAPVAAPANGVEINPRSCLGALLRARPTASAG
jgi:hypothetical protein